MQENLAPTVSLGKTDPSLKIKKTPNSHSHEQVVVTLKLTNILKNG